MPCHLVVMHRSFLIILASFASRSIVCFYILNFYHIRCLFKYIRLSFSHLLQSLIILQTCKPQQQLSKHCMPLHKNPLFMVTVNVSSYVSILCHPNMLIQSQISVNKSRQTINTPIDFLREYLHSVLRNFSFAYILSLHILPPILS